ncbi:MAG: hypothetical protein IJZ70_00030, partial [Bacteroidales bacterium]|nr:hypothetical protein [Bacteroidales bacterium]
MAATMQLGAINKDGLAQIFISIQDRKSKTHIRQATGLYINASIWEKRNDEKALDRYSKNEDIMRILNSATEIRRTIDGMFKNGTVLNANEVRELVREIVYREEMERERKEKEEAERQAAEKAKITLVQFIDKYVTEIKSGARQTERGTNFSPNTVR